MVLGFSLAFSPCPNDTFLFYGLLHGKVGYEGFSKPSLLDIDRLNKEALQSKYDVIKVSMGIIDELLETYTLLPVGSALGVSNGPKLVSLDYTSTEQLRGASIAVPGRSTTAFKLMRALCPQPSQVVEVTYDQVPELVKERRVDFGLIIHETRFQLRKLGLIEVCDLGLSWQEKTGCSLPLGGIVAKRSLGNAKIGEITRALQDSLIWGWRNPQETLPYILKNAIEKDVKTVGHHIDLYVNDETWNLSHKGIQSIYALMGLDGKQELENLKPEKVVYTIVMSEDRIDVTRLPNFQKVSNIFLPLN